MSRDAAAAAAAVAAAAAAAAAAAVVHVPTKQSTARVCCKVCQIQIITLTLNPKP